MRLSLIPPLLALAWGLNWPTVKILLGAMPPFTLRWVGLGSAAALLALLALWRGAALRPRRGDWPGIAVGGLLTVAAFNLCIAWAQLHTSTARAAVLTYTMPMMSVLLAWSLLGERPDRWRALALLMGLTGIGVLAWPVLAGGDLIDANLAGLLLPLVAALAWALGTVAGKRWPTQGDRVATTAWQLGLAALVSLGGALALGEHLPDRLSPKETLALAYHVVVAMALAYVLWFALLDRVGAGLAALTTLAVPVVGVLGAMALVGDRPAPADWAGFALVLAGAALVVLRLRRT